MGMEAGVADQQNAPIGGGVSAVFDPAISHPTVTIDNSNGLTKITPDGSNAWQNGILNLQLVAHETKIYMEFMRGTSEAAAFIHSGDDTWVYSETAPGNGAGAIGTSAYMSSGQARIEGTFKNSFWDIVPVDTWAGFGLEINALGDLEMWMIKSGVWKGTNGEAYRCPMGSSNVLIGCSCRGTAATSAFASTLNTGGAAFNDATAWGLAQAAGFVSALDVL